MKCNWIGYVFLAAAVALTPVTVTAGPAKARANAKRAAVAKPAAKPVAKPAAKPAAKPLTVVSPVEYQVVQRDAQDRGRIPVSVCVPPEAAKVRVRAVPGPEAKKGTATDWTELKRDGRFFAGELTAAAGGWYRLEAEVLDAQGAVLKALSVDRVGIGDIFLTYGQSNSASFGQYPDAAESPLVAAMLPANGRWQPCRDPQPTVRGFGGVKGSCWPNAGDDLTSRTGCPVGFVGCGWGGALLRPLSPGGATRWYDTRLRAAIRHFPTRGFRAILFHQGESDAIARTPERVYVGHMKRLILQSRKDAGWQVPWIVANAAAHKKARQESEDNVVLAQRRAAAELPQVFCGPYTDAMEMNDPEDAPDVVPQYRLDNIHFSRAGAEIHGRWWARIISRELLALPVERIKFAVKAESIALGESVPYEVTVYDRDGKVTEAPSEVTAMYAPGVTVAGGRITLNTLPREGIEHIRLFAKTRLPGTATNPEEKVNALTGYLISEPVLLKIRR